MDPLAHTLVGAALSKTRLAGFTPLATPALILGANAPDIDALAMLIGGDVALGVRRGWTHGVVAWFVLPVVLAVLLRSFGRWWAERRSAKSSETPAPRFVALLALSCVGVWSHPLLDWLNTYGIRLLMPFSNQWFYGDVLFIVDPWLWMLAAGPLVMLQSHTRGSVAGWIVLGTLTTLLILSAPIVPTTARWVWLVMLGLVVALRLWDGLRERASLLAVSALTVAGLYTLTMLVGSRAAEAAARGWAGRLPVPAREIMAGPIPADPFERAVIVEADDAYYFLTVSLSLTGELRVRERASPLPKGTRDPVVEAALGSPAVQGLRTWMRFPSYKVERIPSGFRVEIRDARHALRGSLGRAVVELDANLGLVPPP